MDNPIDYSNSRNKGDWTLVPPRFADSTQSVALFSDGVLMPVVDITYIMVNENGTITLCSKEKSRNNSITIRGTISAFSNGRVLLCPTMRPDTADNCRVAIHLGCVTVEYTSHYYICSSESSRVACPECGQVASDNTKDEV